MFVYSVTEEGGGGGRVFVRLWTCCIGEGNHAKAIELKIGRYILEFSLSKTIMVPVKASTHTERLSCAKNITSFDKYIFIY